MTDDRKQTQGASGTEQQNEGEGSRTAAKKYDQDAQRFAESGKVDEKAREAREAIDGPEGEELAHAEAQGKQHSKGEDPAITQKR
jgi:hypothetical protein